MQISVVARGNGIKSCQDAEKNRRRSVSLVADSRGIRVGAVTLLFLCFLVFCFDCQRQCCGINCFALDRHALVLFLDICVFVFWVL